jgi:hypothetical protein
MLQADKMHSSVQMSVDVHGVIPNQVTDLLNYADLFEVVRNFLESKSSISWSQKCAATDGSLEQCSNQEDGLEQCWL